MGNRIDSIPKIKRMVKFLDEDDEAACYYKGCFLGLLDRFSDDLLKRVEEFSDKGDSEEVGDRFIIKELKRIVEED